jgi:HSP20 family protein
MTHGIQKRRSATLPFANFSGLFDDWFLPVKDEARTLTPAMDIEEDDNQIAVRLELPGLGKEDVSIKLEDGVLTVSGEKKSDREVDTKRYHVFERRYGSFSRAVKLPTGVDLEHADASFENGVLTVTVPKAENAKPRTLEIK